MPRKKKTDIDYGFAIRLTRTSLGWDQGDLAARCSIGRAHLSLLERGLRQPSAEAVMDICVALDITPVIFFAIATRDQMFAQQVGEALMRRR